MNIYFELQVDVRTVALLVVLLLGLGLLYNWALAWVLEMPAIDQTVLYLFATVIGVSLVLILVMPVIGWLAGLAVFAGMAISGMPIALGVLWRWYKARTKTDATVATPHLSGRLRDA